MDDDEPPRTSAGDAREHGTDAAILDRTGRLSSAEVGWLRERLTAALSALGARGEIRVAVVGDAAMAAAHERYAGVAGTTDVLTFDLSDEPGSLDADAMVCLDEACRQSATRGHGAASELLLYAVHAALHCLGHDDRDPASAARMHAEEDRVLRAIGVGAVYSAARSGAGGER